MKVTIIIVGLKIIRTFLLNLNGFVSTVRSKGVKRH